MAWTAAPTSTVSETFSMWSAAVEAATTVVVAFAAAALPGADSSAGRDRCSGDRPGGASSSATEDLGRTMPPKARDHGSVSTLVTARPGHPAFGAGRTPVVRCLRDCCRRGHATDAGQTAGHRSGWTGTRWSRATASSVTPARWISAAADSRPIEARTAGPRLRCVRELAIDASERTGAGIGELVPGHPARSGLQVPALSVCGRQPRLNDRCMPTSGRTPMFREWCAFGDDNQWTS